MMTCPVNVPVQVINKSSNPLPKYETNGAAAMDVASNEQLLLEPGQTKCVGTGLFVSIPSEYEIQIRPRSGLAAKKQITVLNSPGTIDSDYRGEIKIILQNTGKQYFEIDKGTRIAQMLIKHVPIIAWKEVESLDDTDRGKGGFGHTG